MGMLGAFLRGAAGPGLIDLSNRLDRRDAMSADEDRRRREKEEDRAWRSEEAQKDRDSRAASASTRTRRSGTGGDDGGGDDADRYAVAELMKREGVSEGKARAMLDASRADQNPLVKTVDDESGGHATPDMERWANINRTIGRALEAGPSKAKSNFDQLTQGEGNEQRNTITGGMLAGKLTPAQAAEGVAATKGEGAYGKGNVNTFSGTPDAVGKSVINENNAQAGSAGRANRDAPDADPLAKLPPGVKARIDLIKKRAEQINGAITKAQADGMWDTGQNPAQAGLVAELQKLDAEARDLLKPYIPEQPKAKPDPAQARREAEAAVAAGAPLDKVNARLKELGLEPIGAPAKAAGTAEKKPPGMLDKISMGIGDAVDAARGAMDTKAQLKARMAEAKAGGKPLTPGEKQLAEKYGIAA